MRDTDFYWHVRTGELIWKNMAIPAIDLYTYTDFDKPWVDLHWGFQLLITAIFHLLGVNGVILFKAAVYTAAVMIAWFAVGRSIPEWKKALIWFPSIIAITGRAYERPEMISLLCLSLILWILERIPRHPRLIWFIPGLMIIWTNFHALFILGVVVCGAFVTSGLFRHLPASLSKRLLDPLCSIPQLIGIGAAAIISPIVNPYLEQGWFFPLVLYRKFSVEHDFYSPRVGEFQQPIAFLQEIWAKSSTGGGNGPPLGLWSLFSGQGLIYPAAEFLAFLIAGGTLLWLALATRRISLYRLLLLAGFSHLAWVATRNTSVFSLIAAYVACGSLDDLALQRNSTRSEEWTPLLNQFATICIGIMMAIVLTGLWGDIGEPWKRFGWNEAPHWFGHEAVRFAGRKEMPNRAFLAHFGLAGAYIFHNGPDNKVFMDPRLEVCSRRTFEQWEQAQALIAARNPAWEKLVNPDGKGLPAIILDSRSSRPQINGLLTTPSWRLVFADPAAAVFIHAALADKLGLPMVDPRPLHRPPQ